MKKTPLLCSLASLACLATPAAQAAETAAKAYWNFGTNPYHGNPTVTSAATPPVTVGALDVMRSGNATKFDATSVSSGYTGASGAGNAGVAFGPDNATFSHASSPYFKWTVDPVAPGATLAVTPTALSFGARSTGTGAQKWDLYAISENGAVTNHLGGGGVSGTSWALKQIAVAGNTLSNATLNAGSAIEFRLYGWDFASNAGAGTVTWRVDDLALEFDCEGDGVGLPVPEPPALSAAMTGLDAVTVSWQAVDHATNTLFYASDDPAFAACLPGYDGVLASSPVALSGLSTGMYYFRAKSLGEHGDSAFCATLGFELAEPVAGAFTVLYDFEKPAPLDLAPNAVGNLGFFDASNMGASKSFDIGTGSGNSTPHLAIVADNQPEDFAGATDFLAWTFEPAWGAAGLEMCVTNFSFRSRSTSTGPKSWRLTAECDNGPAVTLGYGEGAMPADTSWNAYGATPNITLAASNQIVFKLYGHHSSGSGNGNWRVDDIQIQGALDGYIPPLNPPALRASDITTSSITVSWDAVARAEGYLFDASRFANFEEILLPGSCMVSGGDLNDWIMTPVVFSTSGAELIFTNTVTELRSTAIDLTGIPNAALAFNARTFGGVDASSPSANRVRVRVRENNATVATHYFTPTNGTLSANAATIDLAAHAGKTIEVWLDAPNAYWTNGSNYRGAGVNNIRVQAVAESYIAPFHDYATNGTSVVVSGLQPNTTYHFRARSVDAAETSVHSAVLSATTLDNTLDPVTGLDANPVKHNSATLLWDAHPGAVNGYHVEVYRTNATSRANGPYVLITQLFKGSNENKVVELTNIGDQPANLAQYDLRRDNGTGFGVAWPLSGATLANGAGLSLGAGQTVLVVRNASSDDWLDLQPALRMAALQFTDNNTVGLFHNGAHVDSAPAFDYTTHSRASTVLSGRVAVDFGEWAGVAVPRISENPWYGDFGLGVFVCASPLFNEVTRGVGPVATSLGLERLRPRVAYTFRVRALGSESYSPWSHGAFTTPEPPKGTVLMVR